jgi:hypothetical protein
MSIKSNPAVGIGGALNSYASGIDGSGNTTSGGRVQDALSAALYYAARGWSVFPCWPRSKAPACPRGFKDATTNPARIRRWWLADRDYNIGIATGIVSRFWVLDVDGRDGATSLANLEAKHGPAPDTLISVTADGCHFWFAYNGPIPCSADDRIGRGLHVRGDGGYVMAPPSVHPDGPVYRWMNDRAPVPAPDWLVRLTRRPQPGPITGKIAWPSRRSTAGNYGKTALDYEVAELANTIKGGRNHALNRASFCLHQLVAGGELNAAEVRHRLIDACTTNGLMSDPEDGPRSVARTIASGARAGLLHPRNRRGA